MRPRKKSRAWWYWILTVSLALFVGWLWYAQRTNSPTHPVRPDAAQHLPTLPGGGKVSPFNVAKPPHALASRSSGVQSHAETNAADFTSRSAQAADPDSAPSAFRPSITQPSEASTGASQTN